MCSVAAADADVVVVVEFSEALCIGLRTHAQYNTE